ncbi:MAG: helix-turn-helix domain-containing protein [Myxococcales bacterium]|nr:helix-turn-helix domain-containing protein [Myxococcales bacterium]
MLFASDKTLELLAAEYGTLGKAPRESWEPKTSAELVAEDQAADEADRARTATRARQRRQLWSVLHKLAPDDQRLVQMVQAGMTHQKIAEEFGVTRATITGRLRHTIERIRFWLEMPAALPEAEELHAHLVNCSGLRRTQAERLQGYLDGASMRDVADVAGVAHTSVVRSIQRSTAVVAAHSERACCRTCRAVVVAVERRRDYRPSTAAARLKGLPL